MGKGIFSTNGGGKIGYPNVNNDRDP
jgi:hypothetical protein